VLSDSVDRQITGPRETCHPASRPPTSS
jgi:hypothetical protein